MAACETGDGLTGAAPVYLAGPAASKKRQQTSPAGMAKLLSTITRIILILTNPNSL
jgi:hypothetical protein